MKNEEVDEEMKEKEGGREEKERKKEVQVERMEEGRSW